MEVTFDPAKDKRNIKKHGISLRRAEDFDFGSALYNVADSQDYGEVRHIAIGWLDSMLYTLTFVEDEEEDEDFHAVSLRRATRQERETMSDPSNRESSNQKYGVPDADSPEWTPERFATAKRFPELPERLQAKLSRVGKRGPQRSPTKTLVSIRLSADVLAALRATGKGWQSAADEALRRQFVK
jgi:uncharacterized DUF497 family protein